MDFSTPSLILNLSGFIGTTLVVIAYAPQIRHLTNKVASENPTLASARQSNEEVKYGQMVFDQAVDNLPRS